MKLLPIFALMLVLAGCGGEPNVHGDYDLSQAAADGHGLLIASFTTDTPYPDFHMWTIMRLRHPNDRGMFDVAEIQAESGCDLDKPGQSPFKDYCGRLVSLELHAGVYEIYWFHTETGNVNFAPLDPVSTTFTIKPGRATYVGNIHMTLDKTDETFLGKHRVPGGWPAVSDQRDRDIPLLEQLVPTLKPELIDYEILILPDRAEIR